MRLPPEILDHIFYFLAADHVALDLCSKAHPVFSDLIERYLYAHITILLNKPTVDWDSFSPSQLFELLSHKPRIANCVNDLRIENTKSHEISMVHWREVARILPKFQRLQKIILVYNLCVEWSSADEGFREAFMDCLSLPSMVEVSILSAFKFPLSAFGCLGIKRLTLDGTFHYPSPNSSSPYSQIESLSIHSCRPLSEIIPWTKTLKLRTLEFYPSPTAAGALRRLPEFLQSSLTSLEFDFDRLLQTIYDPINMFTITFPFTLSCLPHLERLITHANATYTDSWSRFCFHAVTTLIQSASRSLQLVILNFHFNLTSTSFISCLSYIDWSPLTLISPDSSSSHRRIELCISVAVIAPFKRIPPAELLSCFDFDNADLARMVREGILIIRPK